MSLVTPNASERGSSRPALFREPAAWEDRGSASPNICLLLVSSYHLFKIAISRTKVANIPKLGVIPLESWSALS